MFLFFCFTQNIPLPNKIGRMVYVCYVQKVWAALAKHMKKFRCPFFLKGFISVTDTFEKSQLLVVVSNQQTQKYVLFLILRFKILKKAHDANMYS